VAENIVSAPFHIKNNTNSLAEICWFFSFFAEISLEGKDEQHRSCLVKVGDALER